MFGWFVCRNLVWCTLVVFLLLLLLQFDGGNQGIEVCDIKTGHFLLFFRYLFFEAINKLIS